MCQKSEDFNNLTRGDIYFGGSTYDGLKVNSTGPEFDLNLNFKFAPEHLELRGSQKEKLLSNRIQETGQ